MSSLTRCDPLRELIRVRGIDVEKSAYHHLSQPEIVGGKRISRHLSGSTAPVANSLLEKYGKRTMPEAMNPNAR